MWVDPAIEEYRKWMAEQPVKEKVGYWATSSSGVRYWKDGAKLPPKGTTRTHCSNGHAYTPDNTITDIPGSKRKCRICFEASKVRKAERRKANRLH
jgi:hypothetical protein